jgi:hypothetical protein
MAYRPMNPILRWLWERWTEPLPVNPPLCILGASERPCHCAICTKARAKGE